MRGAPAFESWLLSERRRLAAATESVLHEAALGLLARGELDRARGFAVRAAAMSPLDENHQALLIRLYRLAGDEDAAERQYAAFGRLLDAELGVSTGRRRRGGSCTNDPRAAVEVTTDRAVEAVIEAGSAAIAAGAIEPGIASLRSAVPLADAAGTTHLRVQSRLALAEALIHSLRGLDEEGLAHLHEADRLALDDGDLASVGAGPGRAGVRGLPARPLRPCRALAHRRPRARAGLTGGAAKATTYLGSVHSDRGDYPQAVALLDEAARLGRAAGDPRREAYALAMRGPGRPAARRPGRGRAARLAESVALAERGHWLSFLPWPQALQGEVHLARHEPALAAQTLERGLRPGLPAR